MPSTSPLFDAYSDSFKDEYGFRPRGAEADAFLALDTAGQEAALEKMWEGWRLATEAETARRNADIAKFRATVAATGLDPDKYMHLA